MVGLLAGNVTDVAGIGQHDLAKRFQDIEDWDPVFAGRFHADMLAFFLNGKRPTKDVLTVNVNWRSSLTFGSHQRAPWHEIFHRIFIVQIAAAWGEHQQALKVQERIQSIGLGRFDQRINTSTGVGSLG